MGSTAPVGAMHYSVPLTASTPSPLLPHTKARGARVPSSQRKTTLGESSGYDDRDDRYDRRGDHAALSPHDFVRGQWAIELDAWGVHCLPNGCMVCCCPCVAVAQISVRIGVDSYGAALAKQLAFNGAVWALVVLELVYCYRYVSSVFGTGRERTSTPPIVIFSSCLVAALISFVWVRALARLRARVRDRFDIDGSDADDKCAMAWCTPCAIAQMATQVKSYTPGSCDFRAPDALPAYIP